MVSFALDEKDDYKLFLIDLKNKNVFERIARRIYTIRNSIVHSKETYTSRFRPFENEEELIKEIPLIRLIAEDIIINSGKDF